jgi:hypothetical protein
MLYPLYQKFIPKIPGSRRAELAPSYYSIFGSIIPFYSSIIPFLTSIIPFSRGIIPFCSSIIPFSAPLFHFHYSIFACQWNNAFRPMTAALRRTPENIGCRGDRRHSVDSSIIPFCLEME